MDEGQLRGVLGKKKIYIFHKLWFTPVPKSETTASLLSELAKERLEQNVSANKLFSHEQILYPDLR